MCKSPNIEDGCSSNIEAVRENEKQAASYEESRIFGHAVVIEFQDNLGYISDLLASPSNPDFTCLDPHLESETTRLIAISNALMLSLRMFQEPEGNACMRGGQLLAVAHMRRPPMLPRCQY